MKQELKKYVKYYLKKDIEGLTVDVDYMSINAIEDKFGILDLRYRFADGIKCNIAIQLLSYKYMDYKLELYFANNYMRHIKIRASYENLNKVILVLIIDSDSMADTLEINKNVFVEFWKVFDTKAKTPSVTKFCIILHFFM